MTGRRHPPWIIRGALLVALAGIAGAASAPAPAADVRDHLRQVAGTWYDRDADTWKRIEVPRPPAPASTTGATTGGGSPIVAVIMYALIALVVAWVAWQMLRLGGAVAVDDAPRGRAQARTAIGALPFPVDADDGSDPDAALDAALGRGDWSRAVIWIYARQLLHLDGAGVLRLAPGKTNRAYVREAGEAPPPVGRALHACVDSFERVYFGHQAAGEGEVRGLLDLDATMRRAVATPGAPA